MSSAQIHSCRGSSFILAGGVRSFLQGEFEFIFAETWHACFEGLRGSFAEICEFCC